MTLLKPKDIKRPKAPKFAVMPDGREICALTHAGQKEYKRRTEDMWMRQNGICPLCGKFIYEGRATFEHWDGRGMNGGHRDDRIEKDGEPYNSAVHPVCNLLKGSVRQEIYQPVQQAR